MSKRGPLSKIEKFYIEQNLELGVEKLASELDRAKSIVKAYASKCDPPVQKEKTPLSDQIVSNKRGSTVMTENGSMLSDDFKSNKRNQERKRPDCVAEIK
tara:strand:+ start:351 stop:650 length:300 start_codon:yes stop_codon:yes gene_type:complete